LLAAGGEVQGLSVDQLQARVKQLQSCLDASLFSRNEFGIVPSPVRTLSLAGLPLFSTLWGHQMAPLEIL
jgi:hypothetical protein